MNSNRIPVPYAIWVALALVLALGSGVAIQSQSVFNNERFELGDGVDPFVPGTGDVSGASAQLGLDWDDLFREGGNWKDAYNEYGALGGNGVPDYLDRGGVGRGRSDAGFVADDISAGTNTDGSVFVSPTLVGSGTVDASYDLGNAYAYTVFDKQANLILYGGLESLDSGTGSTVFEFTRDVFSIDTGGTIVGEKSVGDLRVQADSVAGTLTSMSISKWVENPQQPGVFDWAPVELLPVNPQSPAEQCNAAGTLCVVCNLGSVDGGTWKNYDASGAIVTDIASNRFLEFGINLSSTLGVHDYDNFYDTRYAGIQITTFDTAPSPNPQDYALGSFVRASKLVGK